MRTADQIRATMRAQGIAEDHLPGRTVRARRAGESLVGGDLDARVSRLPKLPLAQAECAGDGDLVVLRVLGEGGMGVVRLARQRSLDREVALKTVLPERVSPESSRALLREARFTGLLEHPNIIPVHAVGTIDGSAPVIVMKRVEGVAWEELLADPRLSFSATGEWDKLARHLEILMQVAQAAHFAHSRGVLHRDVKPSNVMVGDYGEVYLVDWGLAMRIGDATRGEGEVGPVVGTPCYMAPEMVEADPRRLGARTDVYLLGAALHEVLTGVPRHPGNVLAALARAIESPPATWSESVPAALGEICNRACAADPADRFASALELRRALGDLLAHHGSIELAEAATQRLAELQTVVADGVPGGDEDAVMLEAHRLFSEARFGFEQALREWPDNESAQAGFQAALEAMIEHHLQHRNPGAALALLGELPRARPHLRARLDALREQIQANQQAGDQLARLREDQRLDLAGRRGAIGMVLFGLLIASPLVWLSAGLRSGALVATPGLTLLLGVMPFGLLAFVLLVARRYALDNRVHRNVALSAVLFSTAVLLNHAAPLLADISFHQTVLADMMVVFMYTSAAGAMLHRAVLWAALAQAIAFLVAVAEPAWALDAEAGVVVLVHVLFGWLVRPRDDD